MKINIPFSKRFIQMSFIFLLVIGSFFSLAFTKHQQTDPVELDNVQVDYDYGKTLTVQADYQTGRSVQTINMFFHPDGQDTIVVELDVPHDGVIEEVYDLGQFDFYPFTRIYYWFEWNFSGGGEHTSASYWFDYEDSRFNWKTRKTDSVEIYWQDYNAAFSQNVFNTAKLSIENALQILDVQVPQPLKIIVYPNPYDLQSALQLTNQEWVAGHANPAMGMVLISIPEGPNQDLEIERQLPHELMHIMEYQISGPSYDSQPVWLKEGLASSAELYPNPDYQRILETAVENQDIQPFSSYCASFPKDASGAFQAYAQSSSFVKYLRETYGSDRIQELFLNYRNDLSCEEGFEKTYDISLKEAERNWQKSILGMNTEQIAFRNLSPYLLLSLFIIFPPIISSVWLRNRSSERRG